MPSAKKITRAHHLRSLPRYIIKTLLYVGAILIAGQSPYFALNLVRNLQQRGLAGLKDDIKGRNRARNAFSQLEKQGLVVINRKGYDLHIGLTSKGKKVAGKYQLDELEIEKPKKWDGIWRILIFDISEAKRIRRDALRGKLKEMGFVYLQKSVWIHAYPCQAELEMLKAFFGFTGRDFLFFETKKLGNYIDELKERFNI